MATPHNGSLCYIDEKNSCKQIDSNRALIDPSKKRIFPLQQNFFTGDQEVVLESGAPLILVSDFQITTNFPAPQQKSFIRSKTSYQDVPESISPQTLSLAHSIANPRKTDLLEMSTEKLEIFKRQRTLQSRKEGLDLNDLSDKDETVDIFLPDIQDLESLSKAKQKIKAWLDSKTVGSIFILLIIYALFADDIRTIALSAKVDTVFDVFTIITLLFFLVEIVLNFYVRKVYRWSLFFWLDAISTLAFIPNLTFISSEIFPQGATSAAQLARVSRASQIGARAGRIFRSFRMLRITKFFGKMKEKAAAEKNKAKIYPLRKAQPVEYEKIASTRGDSGFASAIMADPPPSTKGAEGLAFHSFIRRLSVPRPANLMERSQASSLVDEFSKDSTINSESEALTESRVGKKLADLTTKRVVVVVLALLTLLPMFESAFYNKAPDSGPYELKLLGKILNTITNSTTKTAALDHFISQEASNNPKLIFLQWGDILEHRDNSIHYNNLRDSEIDTYRVETVDGELVAIFDMRREIKLDSWLSIGRTIFIICVFLFGALLFIRDANNLVLLPIERMIDKVNKIAKDPLHAKEERLIKDVDAGFQNETLQIENAIIKIGGLLALSYGVAGSRIIAQNMTHSGEVDPMLPGKKIAAVFGFCDIRNFTDVTEVLQEGVMVFVNSIADIVHSVVDRYTGAANKNVGDAFLLVWKIPDDDVFEDLDGSLSVLRTQFVQNRTDLALMSFLKIHAKLNKDPTLLSYRTNEKILARLPNYKVKMGFGLHLGWAIEGAIGSDFKIDASYLSPNVNLTSRIEEATKQYGVPLLFSGELQKNLSSRMQEKTRKVDVVTLKGSTQPIEIYTCDVDVNDLIISRNRDKMPHEIKKERQKAQKTVFEDILHLGDASEVLELDKELQHLFRNYDTMFQNVYGLGLEAYIEGDWSLAKKKFEECLVLQSNDGPTRNLMAYLSENDFIAPEDWSGFRTLTDK